MIKHDGIIIALNGDGTALVRIVQTSARYWALQPCVQWLSTIYCLASSRTNCKKNFPLLQGRSSPCALLGTYSCLYGLDELVGTLDSLCLYFQYMLYNQVDK